MWLSSLVRFLCSCRSCYIGNLKEMEQNVNSKELELFFINSHTAMAGAIIGLLLVFLNSRTPIAGAILVLHLFFFTIHKI